MQQKLFTFHLFILIWLCLVLLCCVFEGDSTGDLHIGNALLYFLGIYDRLENKVVLQTNGGKIVALLIKCYSGLLLGVLTGLLASKFSEAATINRHRKYINDVKLRLHLAFHPVKCPHTGIKVVPRYLSLATLQSKLNESSSDIIEAVKESYDMRLCNLATTYSVNENQTDKLIVECFPCEGEARSYGYYISRCSKVTIASTSSVREIGTGHFAYLLAKFGGFNYISKEYTQRAEEEDSFYNIEKNTMNSPLFLDFKKDLLRLCNQEVNSVVIFILSTTKGPSDVIHFYSQLYSRPNSGLHFLPPWLLSKMDFYFKKDHEYSFYIESYRAIYHMSTNLTKASPDKFPKIKLDCGKKSLSVSNIRKDSAKESIQKILAREYNHLKTFTIQIPWEISARDNRHIMLAKTLAEQIYKFYDNDTISSSLKIDEDVVDYINRKEYPKFEMWMNILHCNKEKNGKA